MKKNISLIFGILSSAIVFLFSCSNPSSSTPINNPDLLNEYSWEYDDTSFTAAITDYLGINHDVEIPGQIIKNGNIYTVINIDNNAFYKKGLISVDIPDSVISIGIAAFSSNSLIEVRIGDSVETIGSAAFHDNDLRTVTIPASVTLLNHYAFDENPGLGSIEFKGSGTLIKGRSFFNTPLDGIPALEDGKKPAKGIYTADSIFVDNDTAYYLDKTANTAEITAYLGSDKVVIIPDKIYTDQEEFLVTTIKAQAFIYKDLTALTMGSNIEIIEKNAFAHNNLLSLTVPQNVQSIGDEAFSHNANLGSVIFQGDKTTYLGVNVFGWTLLRYLEALKGNSLPQASAYEDNRVFIDDEIAYYITGDDEVEIMDYFGVETLLNNIPESVASSTGDSYNVVSIGDDAFRNFEESTILTNVLIPNTVTSIGSGAFQDNDLSVVDIGNNVTSIGSYAFEGNDLTEVIIPATVISIEDAAFGANPGLLSVEFKGNATVLGLNVFTNTPLDGHSVLEDNKPPEAGIYTSDGIYTASNLF